MSERRVIPEKTDQAKFSDEEINEVADWLESLTFDQLVFLKSAHTMMIAEHMAVYYGVKHVH